MITWHRRAGAPLARPAVPGRAAARSRRGGGGGGGERGGGAGGAGGGGGDDGEGLDVVLLVRGAGAGGVVTEHDSPDWLGGRERITAGADTLTSQGQRARP